ncbi:MAG: LCP family protein [Acidibacillus sp.]|nr:LCP family protein [Acidibacillus sp.]
MKVARQKMSLFVAFLSLFSVLLSVSPSYAKDLVQGKRYTLLIAGLDHDGTSNDPDRRTDAHTDALVLLSSKLGSGVVNAVHIPRDTRVYVPHEGYTKINGVYLLRGRKGLSTAVSTLTGIPIDDVLVMDFARFRHALSLVPRMPFTLDRPVMAPEGDVHLSVGTHVLSPAEALAVVRFRHEPLGDIGRVHRQERFMRSAVDVASKLPYGLFVQVMKTLDSQVTDQDIQIAYALVHPVIEYHAHSVPGNFSVGPGVSYWLPDHRGMSAIAALVLHHEEGIPAFSAWHSRALAVDVDDGRDRSH